MLRAGRYEIHLTPAGTGWSRLGDLALTAWSGDLSTRPDGFLPYLRDLDDGSVWLPAGRPNPVEGAAGGPGGEDPGQILRSPGLTTLTRRRDGIDSLLEVCVLADGRGELRRLTLTNGSGRPRRLELTTCVDVALAPPAAHAAHPLFSKLFLQTELLPTGALLARRRPRAPGESWPVLVHAVLGDDGAGTGPGPGAGGHETDRARFWGRSLPRGLPRALRADEPLSGTVGPVLDPILCLRRRLELEPGQARTLTLLLGAVADPLEAELLVTDLLGPGRVETALAAAVRSGRAAFDEEASGRDEARRPRDLLAQMTWADRLGAALPAPDGAPVVLIPTAGSPPAASPAPPAARPGEALLFDNGRGGFDPATGEYVVRLPWRPGEGLLLPPRPWVNVIAEPDLGFLVSESGAGCTWGANSRERRLTPWRNDPVLDPHDEAFYLRDEESGAYRSLLPGPMPAAVDHEARHAPGRSRFRHEADGLAVEATLFKVTAEPLRATRVRIGNRGPGSRRLSLFAGYRLVLGETPDEGAIVIKPGPAPGSLTAHEAAPGRFAGEIAFAAVALPPGAGAPLADGEWNAFLGPGGTPSAPAVVAEGAGRDLGEQVGALHGTRFAQQVRLTVAAGEEVEVAFLLGVGRDARQVADLISRHADLDAVARAERETEAAWRRRLDGLRIQTPSPALDLLVNGWLPYQTLSCRLWGRTAFQQSGGAWGFRDQLQDAASLLPLDPGLLRRQLLLHAGHQFQEGDVLHWWHPPDDRGLRTRFADDLLWLPYLAAGYVAATGDVAILDEVAPYLTARRLAAGEDEAFLQAERSGEEGTLLEHCCRAVDRSLAVGAHGLPLFGTGDWNDGMNRVGREGRGESVWMGFFLGAVLDRLAPLCEQRGERERAVAYRRHRDGLKRALEAHAWDGDWYLRGWYDDGAPLGSHRSDECRIDALVQAWAVLSGMADLDRAARALDSVERELVSERDGLIRLLAPPFDRTPHDPGYIKGYLPGVRENGGQYTHAALWVVRALARLGRNDRVARLLEMIGPVRRSADPEGCARYGAEPYVVAADIYGEPPHVGRGGWTWYTGSAGWMYRVAVESLLGLELRGGRELRLRPCVPDDWPGFRLRWRVPGRETVYEIVARNPHGAARRVAAATLDGRPLTPAAGACTVPLADDGAVHRVELELGPGGPGAGAA